MQLLSWLWSDPLPVGQEAPAFTAVDEAGKRVSLLELRGKNVILVFYPADDTPGCTKQVCDLRDNWAAVEKKNAVVYGVNSGSPESHKKFADKFELPFPLLVDEGQRIAKLYNAHGLIVKRTVYLISPEGKILFAERGMPTPEEILRHS